MEPYFAQKKCILKDQLALKDELMLTLEVNMMILDGLYYAMKKCYTPSHVVETKKQSSLGCCKEL